MTGRTEQHRRSWEHQTQLLHQFVELSINFVVPIALGLILHLPGYAHLRQRSTCSGVTPASHAAGICESHAPALLRPVSYCVRRGRSGDAQAV